MSQHDYIIADASGSAFLADLNLAVKALAENNYGTTEPAVMYAHMWWADTTADILKKRNAANTGWISYLTLSTGAPLVTTGTWAGNATTATTATTATNQSGGTVDAVTSSGIGVNSAISGIASTSGTAINGVSNSGYGVYGTSTSGYGVRGESTSSLGLAGISSSSIGVYGLSTSYIGVVAESDAVTPVRSAFRIVPQTAIPTGPNQIGDLYVTSAGVLKICTIAGSPGTWVSVGAQT